MNGRDTVFALLLALLPGVAQASSCTSQSQLSPTDRTALSQAAATLAGLVQADNITQLKADTIASIQAQFSGIANGVETTAPQIQAATLSVVNLYLLDATDLTFAQDVQFFCGIAGTPQTVVFDFQGLPPGRYAVAMVEANGGKSPQRLTFILGWDGQWKLAGFYPRPLAADGHDGVWYWTKARGFAQKQQNWNAYFYYETARWLLVPVDILSSPNLDKLDKELEKARPTNLPGAQPMTLSEGGHSWKITDLKTDSSLGGLDLSITYAASTTADPVADRADCIALMKTLLAQHPELREAFHGLWVHAQRPNQAEFAVELPMGQIQ
jgi:uncharacterized protein (DUF2141 family)